MRVLYIGGTGEISYACVQEAVRQGQQAAVFNRGQSAEALPKSVEQITGDLRDDAAYASLADRGFDVVCQYLAFKPADVRRDIETFAGKVKQYVFISSASAYQKPCRDHIITEATPLENPFWEYSRNKAACEKLLLEAHAAGRLPVTVVRPSHTHRTRFPGTVIPGDHLAWRLIQGKPIFLHADGQSLWTLTHSDDFARAFVGLCGNERALGEAYHITRDRAHTWEIIIRTIARTLEVEADVHYVSLNVLERFKPQWADMLRGDKGNSVVFDNTKVSEAVGGWSCKISLDEGLERTSAFVKQRLAEGYSPNAEDDALIDRMLEAQARLGG